MTTILSEKEIEDYLGTLDLDNNTDIKVALMSLTPLSLEVFQQVISGLASASINIIDILQLPTINDFTINKLLVSKLDANSEYMLAQQYRNVIVPKYTEINKYKKLALGNIVKYIGKLLNEYTYIIKPKYNYIVSESYGFYNFDDIIKFYIDAANSSEVTEIISQYSQFMTDNRNEYPDIIAPDTSTCNLCKLVKSTQVEPYFLLINNSLYKNNMSDTLHWLLNDIYSNVQPENFDKIMNDNYKLMAKYNAEDKALYGETGKIILDKVSIDWSHINTAKTMYNVDKLRINTYYLPLMYGETELVDLNLANFMFITVLLDETRNTLLKIRNIINDKFNEFYELQRGS